MAERGIGFDKNGVPLFGGDPNPMDEYDERCWGVYYAEAGYADDQAVTAVKLRSGLSDVAYEVARGIPGIPYADLITTVNKERPL